MKKVRCCFVLSFLMGFILIVLTAAGGAGDRKESKEKTGLQEKEVSTSAAEDDRVLVGGMPVGIYMETDGVMVLGTEKMKSAEGVECEPAARLVKAGDYITAVDHKEVADKKELSEAVEKKGGQDVVLTLRREGEYIDVNVSPVECSGDEYRLGIWVRDNVQGLGTITFLTENSRFGALGHGIHDTDTNVLMSISEGRLYRTGIQDIIRGEDGFPGSMEGIIVYNRYNILGEIEQNTEAGIYGTVDKIDELFEEQIAVETAVKEEITTGSATIRCCIDNQIEEYDIEVTEVDTDSQEINKGLVIKVTDPELLKKTGGIIQGMSGSPILQNGKLIGAVTHVFVQDSTMGYGIFIENMMKYVEKSGESKNMSN